MCIRDRFLDLPSYSLLALSSSSTLEPYLVHKENFLQDPLNQRIYELKEALIHPKILHILLNGLWKAVQKLEEASHIFCPLIFE